MNKILLLMTSLVTCNALALMKPGQDSIRALPTPGIVEEYYGPVTKPKTAQDAFDKVLPKLEQYKRKATPSEIENFVNYLDYYKSWGGYQSVTPAPLSITNKLTPNDRSVEKYIKYEAQDFVMSPEQMGEKPRMGASTLSRAGEDYYLMVINYFKPSTRGIKPMPKQPAPQKKPMPRPMINY